jgi:glycosyltransferase involved in cell wall biosynthesis
MKVAIVHPWFVEYGGGERVVDILATMYPNADIFALSANTKVLSSHLKDRTIQTSGLDRLIRLFMFFGLKPHYLMFLFPWAVEGLDVSKYDLVISSCGPAVMGVNIGENAIHIAYVHTPHRAWWDYYSKRQAWMSWIPRQFFILVASFIRVWEFSAMQRVDYVVSNSNYIANRISRYFRRQSTVIYPPTNTSMGYLSESHDDYYLSLSRLSDVKRIDLMIIACNCLKRRLLVVGTGHEEKRLKAMAGPTIKFLGFVRDEDIPPLYARCRAFLFAEDTDSGISPLEAQAFGRPVIAYGHGGSLETVRVNEPGGSSDTGVFFAEQTVDSLMDGILRFETQEEKFVPKDIQQRARQFDTSVFVKKMKMLIDTALEKEKRADAK